MARNFDLVQMQLASNIRALRSEAGLSQEQLALRADVDRTYVSQIERAIGNPSLAVLCRLGAILERDVRDLLAGEEQPLRRRP